MKKWDEKGAVEKKMKKILIVDDEHDIGILLMAMLKGVGHKVEFATSFDKASELIEKNRFSTIFLDLNLGIRNGLELVPLIKKSHTETNVVIITALEGNGVSEQIKNAGITKLLLKPFSKKEVLESLN